MANIIHNYLRFTGPQSDINRFIEQGIVRSMNPDGTYSDNLDFNAFLPLPDGADKRPAQVWGTSSSYGEGHLTASDGKMLLRFKTAWTPPVSVIRAIAAQFPSLEGEFGFVDECCERWGSIALSAGNTLNAIYECIDDYPTPEMRFSSVSLRFVHDLATGTSIDAVIREQMQQNGFSECAIASCIAGSVTKIEKIDGVRW